MNAEESLIEDQPLSAVLEFAAAKAAMMEQLIEEHPESIRPTVRPGTVFASFGHLSVFKECA